jgi:23S rRNA pseudouridine1911/1915/1917 synthase
LRREHRVPLESRGVRLDQHLAKALPELSRSRLKGLIDQGQVAINGRVAKAAQRLTGGEAISLEIPEPAPTETLAQDLPLSILFEDKALLVVNKAAGMVVHPSAGHAAGTLVNALLFRVKDLAGVGGELRPGIVHRLDRDTSGCLVVAKDERSLRALQASFKSREIQKTYLALVHGQPKDEARIETRYGRHPVHRKRFTGKLKEGKEAVTVYRTRERFEGAAELEVDLLTGRTHQIRVHLTEAGHPLLGDQTYGAKAGKGAVRAAQEAIGRQALHAWRLSFPHPRTGKPLSFEAPVPADFEAALEILRAGAHRRR